MYIQNLPSEIRSQILRLLPKSALFECLTLCQSWSLPVLEEFYREFTLSEHNVPILQEKLRQQTKDGQRIAQLDRIGPWVKKIIVTNNQNTYCTFLHAEVLAFFSYFPNLKILEFTQTNDFQLYIETMALSMDTEKYWPHLQNIIIPYQITVSAEVMGLYLTICYRLRTSITSLLVHHPQIKHSFSSGKFGNYICFLPDFKKLTHLVVYNYNYYNADIGLTMFEILEACPNLIEYQFCTDLDMQDAVADVFLESLDEKYNKGGSLFNRNKKHYQPLYNMRHLNTFQNIHLKYLFLEFPVMRRAYMKYIVSYVDAHRLDTIFLVMKGADNNFDDWMMQGGYDKSATTVLEFANHLNSVKNFTIRIDHNKERRPEESDSSSNEVMTADAINASFDQQLERFWKFVAAIRGNRELYCHANFNFTDSSEQPSDYVAKFEVKDNQKLTLEYTFVIDHYLNDRWGRSPIPLLCTQSEKDIVNLLSIYVLSDKYVLGESKKAELLHSVHRSFYRLEELYINYPYTPQSRYMLKSSNKIVIKNINDNKNWATRKWITSTAENLTHAKIHHPSLTPELFKTISSDLPNLKTLQYKGFRFEYDHFHNAEVYIRYIKNLDHLEILLSDFKFKQYKRVVIVFEYGEYGPLWNYTTGDLLNGETQQMYNLKLDEEDEDEKYYDDPSSLILKISWGGNIKRFTLIDIFENNTFEVVLPLKPV